MDEDLIFSQTTMSRLPFQLCPHPTNRCTKDTRIMVLAQTAEVHFQAEPSLWPASKQRGCALGCRVSHLWAVIVLLHCTTTSEHYS